MRYIILSCIVLLFLLVSGCNQGARQMMIPNPENPDDPCLNWCEKGINSRIDNTEGKTGEIFWASDICQCN